MAVKKTIAKPGKAFGKAGGKAGGKGKKTVGGGGGGGAWQWVLVQSPVASVFSKKGGKGKGGKGGKGGKAAGKSARDASFSKTMDKLSKVDAELKVWIGGLAQSVTWKKLEAHCKEGDCKPHLTEVMSKGTACLAFKTAEDASNAIAILNGSELAGKAIQVDVWTQKEKKGDKPAKPVAKAAVKKKLLGVSAAKFAKKTPLSKQGEQLKQLDNDLKVWVGGLDVKTTWKQLKKHFTDLGCECELAEITKSGRGCVGFKTSEEATAAIAVVNATDLAGKTIEVDVWTKPEKKSKPATA